MEGNLQKNNSEAIPKNSRTKSFKEQAVGKEATAKKEQKNKPKKGLYEIRTMQHDLDKAKGKNVSTLSLTEENLSAVGKKSKIEKIRSGEIKSISPLTAEDSLKEGSIGFDAKEKQSLRKPSLSSLRGIFEKKIIFKLATILIIIVFISGASFYFYKSGAFSSFGHIKEMINDLFNKTAPGGETPAAPLATSTPNTPIPVEPTSTTPIIDDTQLKYSPAFFSPDDEEVIKVNTLEEVYPNLKANFEKGLKEENFKRIIVLAQNDFSNISLAQMWKTLKTLALGEKYTELISAEIVESWGLAMPRGVDKRLSENYNLFFYGQPEDGPRTVLIFKIGDISGLKDEMFLWEKTMIYDLRKLFLGMDYGEAASVDYSDNIYKNIDIRYLNLPKHDLAMDYAIMPDKGYLILSTSRESIWATIDKILGAEERKTSGSESIDISEWTIYTNKDYEFEVKYSNAFSVYPSKKDDYSAVLGGTGELARIKLEQQDYYQDTNLKEASIVIGAKQDKDSIDNCSMSRILAPTSNEAAKQEISQNLSNEGLPAQKKVNDVLFYRDWSEEGATGDFYETIIYKTSKNGICYNIALFINSSNIQLYDAEIDISEYNRKEIIDKFNQILSTFKFNG